MFDFLRKVFDRLAIFLRVRFLLKVKVYDDRGRGIKRQFNFCFAD